MLRSWEDADDYRGFPGNAASAILCGMNDKRAYLVCAGLAAGGFAVWFAVSTIYGLREAWDGPGFLPYTVSMIALNAAAGFLQPRRVILNGLLSVALQPAAIFVKSGEVGSLFPLGLIAFLVLGLLFSVAGKAAAIIKRSFFSEK